MVWVFELLEISVVCFVTCFLTVFFREWLADQSDDSPVLRALLYTFFFLLERHLIQVLILGTLRCFLEESKIETLRTN